MTIADPDGARVARLFKNLRDIEQVAAIQDDVAAMLRALGLGDHARPESAHTVIEREVLPAIAAMQSDLATARAEAEEGA